MPVNYSKWANIEDSDDDAEDASHFVPAGAETLPDDAIKAFLDTLCERTLSHLEAGTGLEICCGALAHSLPGEGSIEDELKEHVLATHFYFPDCLPSRWRGREQLRLAGEQSAGLCISEILEDLKFGVLTRDSLFKAAGSAHARNASITHRCRPHALRRSSDPHPRQRAWQIRPVTPSTRSSRSACA